MFSSYNTIESARKKKLLNFQLCIEIDNSFKLILNIYFYLRDMSTNSISEFGNFTFFVLSSIVVVQAVF